MPFALLEAALPVQKCFFKVRFLLLAALELGHTFPPKWIFNESHKVCLTII